MIARRTLGALLCMSAITSVQADAPRPIIIRTQVVFAPLAEGTFEATAPLCASGTFRTLRAILNPSLLQGHGFTAIAEYACDDNSGTFIIQVHPQSGANYAGGTRDPEFTVAGPWSFVPGGSGRYAKISGHGDFGVVIDLEQDPWTGEESFTGFVRLN
jgi:hypothetical protein